MEPSTTPLDDPEIEKLLANADVDTPAEATDPTDLPDLSDPDDPEPVLAALEAEPSGGPALQAFAARARGIAAPALLAEVPRLKALGGTFSGIIGNAAHTYGYHLPPSRLRSNDYSLRGAQNRSLGEYCCALDGGMDWPASRQHLAAVVAGVRSGRIKGMAEIIGSLDGRTALYWCAARNWRTERYSGTGHVSWSHFAIFRSTARTDHGIYAGWGPNGPKPGTPGAPGNDPGGDDMPSVQDLWNTPLDVKGVGRFSPLSVLMELYLRSVGRGALGKGLTTIDEIDADVDAIQVDVDGILARLDKQPVPPGGGAPIDYDKLATALAPKLADILAPLVASASVDEFHKRLTN